jgi:hypothetical protein
VDPGLVFHTALNEKVISENLSNGTILLEHIAAFACFFREGVQKIESSAIRIHRREEVSVISDAGEAV